MPTMEHKAGTELQTGATSTGIAGVHTQSSGKNAGGELKIIHDANGAELAAYAIDPHTEMTFVAVLASGVADREIGDIIIIGEQRYLVKAWNVTESNEDVKKVSISVRSTSLSVAASAP